MDKDQSKLIMYNSKYTKQLFHYLSGLGYTDEEIKGAILYYNLHHTFAVQYVQLPLAIGFLVRIIEGGKHE